MHSVTLGGVTIGVGIILINSLRWWFHEHHKIAALVPFLLAIAYGMLAILCAGSLLGTLAGTAMWGSSGLGDLSLVYGVGAHSPNVTMAHQIALSDGGRTLVFLFTGVIVALGIWAKKVSGWKLLFGSLSGACLGLSGTIAGIAAVPLASAVNAAGLGFTAVLR